MIDVVCFFRNDDTDSGSPNLGTDGEAIETMSCTEGKQRSSGVFGNCFENSILQRCVDFFLDFIETFGTPTLYTL